MRNTFFFLMVAFVLILTSCSRPESNISVVRLDLSSLRGKASSPVANKGMTRVLSAATLRLKHLVVNVSGNGIAVPIVRNWDIEDQNNFCVGDICTIADLPAGDQRFFQVFAFYIDESTMGPAFYYKDLYKDLKLEQESVSVILESVLTGLAQTDGKSVSIRGRYLTGTNFGPTGPFIVRFKPGVDKPAMIIDQGETFGGWFSAFGLTGVPFEYDFNGVLLGGRAMKVNELMDPALSSQLRLNWGPSYYKNNSGVMVLNKPEAQLFGFFGSAATGTKVCHPGTLKDFNHVFKDAAGLYPLQFDPAPSPLPSPQIPIVYPLERASSTCQTASVVEPVTSRELYIDPTQGGLQFRGPYRSIPDLSGGNFFEASITAGTMGVYWIYLPDLNLPGPLGAPVLQGTRIFGLIDGKIDPYKATGMSEGYSCFRLMRDRMASNGNIRLIADVPYPGSSYNFIPGDFGLNQNSGMILCPYSAPDILFNAGIGRTATPVTGAGIVGAKYEISAETLPQSSLAIGKCMRVTFKLQDSVGQYIPAPASGVSLTLSTDVSGTTLPLYNDNAWFDCENATPNNKPSGLQFQGGADIVSFLVKNPMSTIGVFNISATGSDAQFNSIASANTLAINSRGGAQNYLDIGLPPKIIASSCYPINLTLRYFSGGEKMVTSASTVDFTGTDTTALSLYANATCSTPVDATNAITLASGSSRTTVWVKGNSASPNVVMHAILAGAITDHFYGERLTNIANEANTVASLFLSGDSALTTNSCASFKLTFQNANGTMVPVSVATSIELAAGNVTGTFYTDLSCTFPVAGSPTLLTIGSSGFELPIYFKPTSNVLTSGTNAFIQARMNSAAPWAMQMITLSGPTAMAKITGATGNRLPVGSCVALTINLFNFDQIAYAPTTNLNLNIKQNNFTYLGSDSSCSGASVVANATVLAGSSSTVLYGKVAISQEASFMAYNDDTDGDGTNNIESPDWRFVATDTPATAYEVRGERKLAQGQCYEGRIHLRNAMNGAPSPWAYNAGANSYNFTLASGSSNGVNFYGNSRCQGAAVTSVPIAVGNGMGVFSYKLTSFTAATGVSLNVTSQESLIATAITPDVGTGAQYALNYAVGPATFNHFAYDSVATKLFDGTLYSHQYKPGACMEFSILATNNVGAEVSLPAIMSPTIQFESTAGATVTPQSYLYSNPGCTDTTPASNKVVSIQGGQSRSKALFFQVPVSNATGGYQVRNTSVVGGGTNILQALLLHQPFLKLEPQAVPFAGVFTKTACTPLTASLVDSNKTPYTASTAQSFALSVSGGVNATTVLAASYGSDYSFYSTNACNTQEGINVLSFLPGETTKTLWIMFNASAAGMNTMKLNTTNDNSTGHTWQSPFIFGVQ